MDVSAAGRPDLREYLRPVLLVPLALAGAAAAAAPQYAAGGALFAAMVAVFLARTEYFIFLLAVYTPLEEFALKWLPQVLYSPARYAGEGFLIALFLLLPLRNMVRHGRFWKTTPLDLPLLALLSVIVASSIVNDVPAFIAALGVKNVLRYVLMYYLVVNTEFSEGFWKKLVYAMLALAVVEALIGVAQYVVGGPAYDFLSAAAVEVGGVSIREVTAGTSGKVFATMGRYNMLGNFLNFFMVMGLGLYYTRRDHSEAGYALFFAVTLAGLLLSFSRMSWVGLYIGFVLILLIQRKKRAIIYLVLPVALTALLIGAYAGMHWYKGEKEEATAAERYVSVFSRGYIEKSLKHDRLFALTVTAPTLIRKYPVLGLGPGTFASEVTGTGTHARGLYPEYSHASRLELPATDAIQYTADQGWTVILCQLGLAGIFCFAWIFAVLASKAYAVYKAAGDPFVKGAALGFLGCLFLLIFQNFVSFNLIYRPVSLYFWLFAAWVCSTYLQTARPDTARRGT